MSLYFILATFIFPQFLSLYNLGIFCLLKCLTTFLFKPPPPLCLFIIFFYVFICFNVNSLSLLCICTLTTFSVQMLICATIILSISVLQCFSLFSPAMFIFSLLCVTIIICISGLQMGYVCLFRVPLCESISVCVTLIIRRLSLVMAKFTPFTPSSKWTQQNETINRRWQK